MYTKDRDSARTDENVTN